MAGARKGNDRTVALWVAAAVVAAIALFALFGPREEDNDPEPTTINAGSHGTKAAYLLLGELGYRAERWEQPASALQGVNAAETTLILTEPMLPYEDLDRTRKEIELFLGRGGRVIATGARGAELLPEGKTATSTRLSKEVCYTTPEGPGAMARAGEVTIAEPVRWDAQGPQYRVEQRCGPDAVVVRYAVGKGEAVWWSSAQPMTNRGLAEDESLKLLVAAVGGPGRRVLFDEYLHAFHGSRGGLLKGLPWWSLGLQALAVGMLLVLSLGRRNGPVRLPLVVPRTSPVEFAESMGRLYGKAGATEAAVHAARVRVEKALREECGVPRELIPAGVAEMMGERFGGDWRALEERLSVAGVGMSGKGALALVEGLDEDFVRVRRVVRKAVVSG